ncbi:hypothetical protein K466DRAFT_112992 [Polyporus arcularius HHB13444]|uniref:Uncharacterized protein n=1 Tax=Polyporus arcularius HHB13444 TaxID=1314778 RepID=A0A5C3PCC9_9APHY|nr:hypothetical protein K466DRAFT_112992 [Polyporus arcularius HHB13444]
MHEAPPPPGRSRRGRPRTRRRADLYPDSSRTSARALTASSRAATTSGAETVRWRALLLGRRRFDTSRTAELARKDLEAATT